jgi:alpha-N-acetylglucosamine transferase
MLKSWIPEVSNLSQHPVASMLKSRMPALEPATQYVVQLMHNKRLVRFVAASLICFFCLGFYYYDFTPLTAPSSTTTAAQVDLSQPTSNGSKYAFATLVSPNYLENADQNDVETDEYFLSARVLNYQLLHSNRTRYHDPSVPFLVLTLPRVAKNKIKILESEGATVIPVEHLSADWIKAPIPQWEGLMSKLFLWTYSKYDKILFIDADVYLIEPLNGIFEDEAAQPHPTKEELIESQDKGALPTTYIMSGVVDGGSGSRENPMSANYMNAGFFLMRPEMKLFQHFKKFINTPDSFSLSMLEQNLINDIFKVDGPMPWQHMDPKWDTSCPEPVDIARGWKSVHSKLWKTHAEPCDVDPVAGRMWYRTLGHMEAFYSGQQDAL